MASQYLLSFMLLLSHILLNGASAAVHVHTIDIIHRESDGSYRSIDAEHYGDSRHNIDFDHEAILGSVKEAEKFDNLSPEDAKKGLELLLPKIDLNGDKLIDRLELKKWILNSFITISREKAEERMTEKDDNRDGVVTWVEYLNDTFGVDKEEEIGIDDTSDSGMLIGEEKTMWTVADINGDHVLDKDEFEVFSNPEEHEIMHPFLVNQTLREKDKNHNGKIDFSEYVSDRGLQHDKAWVAAKKERFDHKLDLNKDGELDASEIHSWVIPNNDEIADKEVKHLFASAYDDHGDALTFEQFFDHLELFVGPDKTMRSFSTKTSKVNCKNCGVVCAVNTAFFYGAWSSIF